MVRASERAGSHAVTGGVSVASLDESRTHLVERRP